MKKVLTIALFVTAAVLATSAQNLLPATVQQFLDDYQYCQRIAGESSASMMIETSPFFPARMIDGQEMVDVFIAYKSPGVISMLQSQGVFVNNVFDDFLTAQVPLERLAAISRLPGVEDVEVSRRMELATDSTMSATHALQVQQGLPGEWARGFDGSGVIVGVIDAGFDYNHRAFRRNDDVSKLRILRLYSTTDNSGHKATYNNGNYRLPGSVFMDDEIYSLTTDNSAGSHGTHTTSIAAGSHVNGYGGMAPGADIVLCSISVLDGSISAVEVANCVRYIDSYADSVGKPCVMSLSISTPNGQHDGSDYLSNAIKKVMGPGRIFVIAAGNNKGKNFYTHGTASQSKPMNAMFKSRNNVNGDSTYLYTGHSSEFWVRASNANFYFKFHVLDKTTGQIVWESQELSSKTTITHRDLAGFYDCYTAADTVGTITGNPIYASAGKKYHLNVSIHNLICHEYTMSGGQKKSRYALGVSIYPRRATPFEVDAWAGITGTGFSGFNKKVTTTSGEVVSNFYRAGSDSCSIGTYAVGDSIISAGAYSARNSYFSLAANRIVYDYSETLGNVASFSSYQAFGYGPTGEALPTICAPGIDVVGACSRYCSQSSLSDPSVVMYQNGNYWCVMSGTSMAAPTVAGIIALWLQANPRLSVAQVKDILARTAIHDSFTNGPRGAEFGPNGKIDALAGMRYVLSQMGFLLGDADGDKTVSITDVTIMIDYLLNGDSSSINLMNADLNGNGIVTIDDLTLLIDKLLQL